MNRPLAAICAAASLCAMPAFAQSPPLEIKGVLFGASMDELLARLPDAKCSASGCTLSPTDTADKQCGSIADVVRRGSSATASGIECRSNAIKELNFGPAPVSLYMFTFRDGKLANAMVSINQAVHSALVIALTEKYGSPTSDKTVPIQNRAGATFENRTVIWDRPDGRIEAVQRGSTVDKGYASMSTPEFLKATIKESIDNAKAAAKNL